VKTFIRKLALGMSAVAMAATVGVGAVSVAPAAAQSSGKAKVEVGDNFYRPKELDIVAGTKVTWTNEGKILHNVTPDKKKQKFGTKTLARGKSYSYTFKKPGTYGYYCSFHGSPGSGQYGTIVVEPAPTPTATTTGPTP
jgi:plastocyanin